MNLKSLTRNIIIFTIEMILLYDFIIAYASAGTVTISSVIHGWSLNHPEIPAVVCFAFGRWLAKIEFTIANKGNLNDKAD